MGTPAFATTCLDALVKAGNEVVAVVTAPDKAAGRGRSLRQSDVKQFALQNELLVLQPTNLKSPEFVDQLNELEPDLIIVVAFRMLPRVVWEMPKYGTINLHASLLPQYRGAAPINWALINGESETGVTTFFINENIDTGDLILQDPVSISANDNAGTLHDKLMNAGAELIIKTIDSIAGAQAPGIPQRTDLELKEAPKIFKEDTRIEWDNNAEKVHDFIRGLSPYPSATTSIIIESGNIDLKIYQSKLGEPCGKSKAGTLRIDNKKHLFIACNDYWLELREIQPAGKRKMLVSDFLNGFQLPDGAKMS